MRAMVYRGPYKVRVEEKDIPAIEHPERRDRAGDAGGDLRIGPAPLPRHDARHPGRDDVRPRVHRRGRARSAPSVQNLKVGRPGDGAVQRLLRLLLLLRPRASTPTATTSTRTPPRWAASTATRTPAAATTAARPSSSGCPFADVGPEPDPGLDGRRGRGPAHRRAAHRLLRRAARRHRRGRRGRGVRRRPGRAVRGEVGLAHGRRPGDRHRPPRLPAGEGADVRPRRDVSTSPSTTTSCVAHEADHRLPRAPTSPSTRSAPRPTATSSST